MKNQSMTSIFNQMRERRLNEEQEKEDVGFTIDEDVEETGTDNSEDELDEAVKTVVKDGNVVKKTVPTTKKRLSTAQKQALAKARKKAHTASAEKERAKSNKKRRAMGLDSEDSIVCPDCGFEGTSDDYDEEDGTLYCPDCGAEITKTSEEVDVAELVVRLDECQASPYMKKALNEGKYDLVKRYLAVKEGE